MASITGSSIKINSVVSPPFRHNQATTRISVLKLVSLRNQRNSFQSARLLSAPRRFNFSCAVAKPETLNSVCEIVRKQLALPSETTISGDSKFSALGADSLDTVEIVMELEEEFGISVEEENAQSIQTIQDAADLIEKLVASKGA